MKDNKTMRFNEVQRSSQDDEYGKWDIDDTRRPRLTLKHLNKLRNQRSIAEKDHAEQTANWKDMYGVQTGQE